MPDTVLICAATVREMDACLSRKAGRFETLPEHGGLAWARTWSAGSRTYFLAITGVGMPLTVARLLPLAAGCGPALIVNVGIAGAYKGSGLAIGDLVAGESECFGDMGMEVPGPEAFQPLAGMAWADEVYRQALPLTLTPWQPFPRSGIKTPRTGKGCTVNACTGREETGALRRKLFSVDFETMEGAGVALTARLLGVPACEIRAISNLAATRDMRPENVDRGLQNLGQYMDTWVGEAS